MEGYPSGVYFIGAGPGDPELVTLKGHRIIGQADLILYAGSLVPPEVIAHAPSHALVENSASMDLAQTHSLLCEAVRQGGVAARVHTGDPSLYGAVREQALLLDEAGIPWKVIPGVTAAFATAASAGLSLTLPEIRQSVIFTRLAGRTPVPERERLRAMAAHQAAMAIYLSGADPAGVAEELVLGGLSPEARVVVGYRVGWPEERIFEASIRTMADIVHTHGLSRQLLFLVLPNESQSKGGNASKLYDQAFSHGFRKGE